MQNDTPSQPDRPQWLVDHRREAASMANEFAVEMAGATIDDLSAVVKVTDVVYAVWNDRASFDGISLLAIKGAQSMWDIVHSGVARALTIRAISCRCAEEAEALRLTIGEPDHLH